MKKQLISILTIYIVLQTSFGCGKKFLGEKLYSNYAPEALTDSLGFEASVVGLQNQVTNWWTYSDNQGWPAVWQVGTDIGYTVPARGGGWELPYNDYATLTPVDGAASYAWTWAFKTILNANNIITNVES